MTCMTAFTIVCVLAIFATLFLMYAHGSWLRKAHAEGRYAGQSGVDAKCCPYSDESDREYWMRGYIAGIADRKNGLAPLKKDN